MSDYDDAADSYAEQISELRALLMEARDKLRHYREAHGGEYVGGVEYSVLMNRIQEALK